MSCNIVVEYFLHSMKDDEQKRTVDFDMEGFCVNEIDAIEEFYNIIFFSRLRDLKSFYIFNYSKNYEIKVETENELYSKLYYLVLSERQLTVMEKDLVDCYKNYLQNKKDFWACKDALEKCNTPKVENKDFDWVVRTLEGVVNKEMCQDRRNEVLNNIIRYIKEK